MPRDLASLVDTLSEIVGPRHVRTALPERVTYAKDGLPTHRRVPGVVVLPGNRDEVIAVVRLLGALGMPFVPRGAGTGLSGGALADGDAVLIVLTRLNRILKIDARNRLAVVEPGVVNIRLSGAAAPHGLQYTPDPSSQTACTIGGNVAENAGGPHCLKYGVTATHVLALEVALAAGRAGGAHVARRLHLAAHRRGGRVGRDRQRDRTGRPRNDGPVVHPGGGGFGVRRRLPAGCRGGGARRARRRARSGGDGGRGDDRERAARARGTLRAGGGGRAAARAPLARPQEGIRRDGPAVARPGGAGRGGPPLHAPRRAGNDRADRRRVRPHGQQRVPRGGR